MGMKQRLGLALAMLGSPDVLLLDEPMNGLDPEGVREMRNLIIRLNEQRGITVVVSSHVLDQLGRIATRYGVLAVGGILGQFEAFLTVLSACGPALAGVMVADYWLVRKGRPANVRVPDGVSAAGVAGLACGIAVALVTGGTFALVPGLEALDLPFFVGPVNGIVVAMAAYALSYRLTGGERFAGPVAFKRPAESAIMNQVTLDASERAQEGQA